jgi:hypothetical protein
MKWTLLSIALGLLAWAGFALAAARGAPTEHAPGPPISPEPPAVAAPPLSVVEAPGPAVPEDDLEEVADVPSDRSERAQPGWTRLDDPRGPEFHRLFSRAMPLQGLTPPPEVVP